MTIVASPNRLGRVLPIASYVAIAWLLFGFGSYGMALGEQVRAKRVVSTNLCTDQLLLLIAKRSRIASVSYLARDPLFSHLANRAQDIPINHGLAEEILPLEPDLVLVGSHTIRPTTVLLRKLGIKVLVLKLAEGFEDIRRNMRLVGNALGETAKVDLMVSQFDTALTTLVQSQDLPTAIILRPRGMTMGQGSLSDAILRSAGLRNLSAEMGVGKIGLLPLEQVVAARPDLFVLAEFRPGHPSLAHLILQHPVLRMDQADPNGNDPSRVALPAHLWNCGGPQALKAIDILKRARLQLLKSKVRK